MPKLHFYNELLRSTQSDIFVFYLYIVYKPSYCHFVEFELCFYTTMWSCECGEVEGAGPGIDTQSVSIGSRASKQHGHHHLVFNTANPVQTDWNISPTYEHLIGLALWYRLKLNRRRRQKV